MSDFKKDGLLVSHKHFAVSGHGRVVLFLHLCAVPDVQSVCFFLAVVSQHTGRAPSECLAERNLFRNVAGSGKLGRADVSKDSTAVMFKVKPSNHQTVDPEDGDITIFRNVCNCLALDSS
jgi:hypothetical protein